MFGTRSRIYGRSASGGAAPGATRRFLVRSSKKGRTSNGKPRCKFIPSRRRGGKGRNIYRYLAASALLRRHSGHFCVRYSAFWLRLCPTRIDAEVLSFSQGLIYSRAYLAARMFVARLTEAPLRTS